jgi:hypothetical protein
MLVEPPTPYKKEKIGAHLSYPLKFSEVLSSLSPAVEQLSVQIWFRAWPAPRQNQTWGSYEVLSGEYWLPRPGRPQAQWWLFVRPIPRHLRIPIRSLLIPGGIARLRDWYLSAHTSVWLSRRQELSIRFVTATESLDYDHAA